MLDKPDKHPNEPSEIVVDSPRPAPKPLLQPKAGHAALAAPMPAGPSPFAMACYNKMTGAFVGYLGSSSGYYVDLVGSGDSTICKCQWSFADGHVWLEVINQGPSNRYIGVGANGYACWGLWTPTGWVNPVSYNSDLTINVQDTDQSLCGPYGNGWVYWGNDATILTCHQVAPQS